MAIETAETPSEQPLASWPGSLRVLEGSHNFSRTIATAIKPHRPDAEAIGDATVPHPCYPCEHASAKIVRTREPPSLYGMALCAFFDTAHGVSLPIRQSSGESQ